MSGEPVKAAPRQCCAPGVSAEKWREFADRYFERSATVLSEVRQEPVVPAPVLFSALTRAADRMRVGDLGARISFWVNGSECKNLGEFLPDQDDGSLDGYIDRLERLLGGAEYTFLLADAHLYSDDLWGRVRVFLRGLYEHAGIPCGGVDTAVFLGRYRRTPFGVHRGQMSVMTLPVHGEKCFRVWRRGFGEAHPEIENRVEYEEFLEGSSQLIGGPGDVLYWPADIWHIAEASETFTATVNIGFWWDRPPLARVLLETGDQLSEVIDESDARGVTFPGNRPPGSLADCLPRNIQEALKITRRIAAGQELERKLALESLRMLSADGFRDVPDYADEPPPQAGTLVRRTPECNVLLTAESNGNLHLAANGFLLTVPDCVELREVLNHLLRGDSTEVPADSGAAAHIIGWMHSVRAIAVVPVTQNIEPAQVSLRA